MKPQVNIVNRMEGIMIKKADALIKDCKIHNHLMGGILLWTQAHNNVKIIQSRVIFNGKVGIHCVGENGQPSIEHNKIENNNGSGVKVGIANKAKLIRNEIKLNQNGVEIISGEPYIFNNIIDKNYSDGIISKVHEDLRCDAKIKNNEISGNKVIDIHYVRKMESIVQATRITREQKTIHLLDTTKEQVSKQTIVHLSRCSKT